MRIRLDRRRFLKLAGSLGAATALGGLGALEGLAQPSGTSLTARQAAARFLTQATLGPTLALIDEAAALGPEAWIEAQFEQPIGLLQPLAEDYDEEDLEEFWVGIFRFAWWQRVMASPDVLRQRIALALSEIFVISTVPDELTGNPWGVANYYDTLLRHAFGNFRDLLLDVTLHPCMGFYLSHVRNRKGNAAENRFPDENYAREVMQLFTIGLFELNPDGTPKQDAEGNPIPTYDNDDITELAKVFTGLTYAGGQRNLDEFLYGEPVFTEPMVMYEPEHEFSDKRLPGGKVLFAGRDGMSDVRAAVDHLFQHPNVGPFIARRLIQRLVKSNPTPAYVARVAAAFADDGQGVRGEMKAVIKAILLDAEARELSWMDDPAHGMLREPFVRYTHLCRALNATSPSGQFRNFGWYADHTFKQHPMHAPSVFNFFLPDHQPLGPLQRAGLVGPEFQIMTSFSAISTANRFEAMTLGDFVMEAPEDDEPVYLDLDLEEAIARDAEALIDHLNLLLCYGALSPQMRTVLRLVLAPLDDVEFRVAVALYLFSISPDFSVLR